MSEQYPNLDLDEALLDAADQVDRFLVYRSLLEPLAHVEQSKKWHPEGDVLYHSLQVYEHAVDALPYDEEFQLAALLHDVGKGIDDHDHVAAGLHALGETITPRTAWLIEHHMEAHKLNDGSIGPRARRRLSQHPDYEELRLLGECDRAGRQRGAQVSELEDALAAIRDLSQMCG